MGVDGIDLEFGLTTSNLEEARLNQRMINSSNKLIVLADSSKFGIRSFAKICPLNKIDLIITDKNISQQMLKKLEEKGISVQIVGKEIKNDWIFLLLL